MRARDRLIARVHMLCLLDNRPVQRVARGLGGALAFHPGEVEAEIGLPWPRPFSLAEEWLDELPPRCGRTAGRRARGPDRARTASSRCRFTPIGNLIMLVELVGEMGVP